MEPIKKLSEFLKPTAPYLALCGDICGYYKKERLQTFLQYCSKHWKRVFFIAGNHEYYNLPRKHLKDVGGARSMADVETWLRTECGTFPNVHFLQKQVFELPEENCIVVGCTLWTEVAGFATKEAAQLMNDYRLIWSSTSAQASVADLNAVHRDHLAWLSTTVGQIKTALPSVRIVVLTHHLPTHRMISPKFAGNPLNSCFASGALEQLTTKPTAWIFGHSHIRDWKKLDGVVCAINSHGYDGEHAEGGNALNTVVDLGTGNVEGLPAIVVPTFETGVGRKRARPSKMEEDEEEEETILL